MAEVKGRTWGKITDEEIEKVNRKAGQWSLQKPYWRDATRDAFRAVARATGNINPLFQDEEYAAKTRWGGLIAFPMIHSSYFRFEGFGLGAPGFAGVHGTYAGGTIRFYRPIRLGDQIDPKEAFWEQKLHPSQFAGRMLDQIARSVLVDRVTGRMVAESYRLGKRWERAAASERKESGKGPYSDWKRWRFTEEELKILWDDFARIQIRGATPRHFEDVQVGEDLPSLVTMPYTGREIIAFYMGYGAPFIMSNAVLFEYLRKHPGLNVPDRETKTPDVPERTHYEAEFAKATGAPDIFDVTFPRMCWATTMVTNWMGDDAFLREISCSARKFNAYGDVTWINGRIVEKYRREDENLVQIALVWDNQRYRHSWGHAIVSLPSREKGEIVLPPQPSDPEGQPYVPMPDDFRASLYSEDPGLPLGSRFQRKA
jgi:acyl dehydratase